MSTKDRNELILCLGQLDAWGAICEDEVGSEKRVQGSITNVALDPLEARCLRDKWECLAGRWKDSKCSVKENLSVRRVKAQVWGRG